MTSSDSGGSEDPRAAFHRIRAVTHVLDHDAFVPSSVLERLVLQVIAAWEQVKSTVNFRKYAVAGPGGKWIKGDNLAAAMKRISGHRRVIYPHDEFAAAVDLLNELRQKFAHLLALDHTEGKFPERTMHFFRLGDPEERNRMRDDTGLKWRDEVWAQQTLHRDSVEEIKLRKALGGAQWMIHVVRAVDHLGDLLAGSPDLPDGHQIADGNWMSPYEGGWWVPWILPEWEGRTTLTSEMCGCLHRNK